MKYSSASLNLKRVMVMGLFQESILQRFRKQKARLGSVVLTLFLASWLNLLVQPCLMAAPIDDCHGSAVHDHSVLPPDSAAKLPAFGVIQLSFSMHCKSMEGCADWDGAYAAISSLDPEKKFFPSAVSSAQIQSGPVSFYRLQINKKPLFSRVSLFIQNCAFLI